MAKTEGIGPRTGRAAGRRTRSRPPATTLAHACRSTRCSRASISRARAWTRGRSPNSRDSIKAQGVMQPILVRPVGDGRYEIIAGERRWRAATHGRTWRACRRWCAKCRTRLRSPSALIENIQREDLNPLEEAAGMQRLIDEFGMTHEEAARGRGPLAQRGDQSAAPARARAAGAGTGAAREDSTWVMRARCSRCRPCSRSRSRASPWRSNSRCGRWKPWSAGLAKRPTAGTRVKWTGTSRVWRKRWPRSRHHREDQAGPEAGSGKVVIDYARLDQLDALLRKLS